MIQCLGIKFNERQNSQGFSLDIFCMLSVVCKIFDSITCLEEDDILDLYHLEITKARPKEI